MTLPESPPNEEAGTFDVSLELRSGGPAFTGEPGRSILQTSRPLVLRYKSPLLRYLW